MAAMSRSLVFSHQHEYNRKLSKHDRQFGGFATAAALTKRRRITKPLKD